MPEPRFERVADQVGYAYAWSASASEVTLSRPGLTVVLRPGNRRYQINDRVAYAGEAPVYENGDSVRFRRRGGRAARTRRTLPGVACHGGHAHRYEPILPPVPNPASASGSLSILVSPAPGRDAVVVDGSAPAALRGSAVPVTLTLTGTISRDLPDRDAAARHARHGRHVPYHPGDLGHAPRQRRHRHGDLAARADPGLGPAHRRRAQPRPSTPHSTTCPRTDVLPRRSSS